LLFNYLKNDNNGNELLSKSNFSNPQNIIDFDNFKKTLKNFEKAKCLCY